jgi:dTDP-glucose 4,6-dehydratase
MRLLITGGAGFIGSNFVKYIIRKYQNYRVTVLDALTYCGNLDNFPQEFWKNPNFSFWHGNICDREVVNNLMRSADVVVHFAAETHVDRSIERSDPFITTDIKGTQVLLEAIKDTPVERFIHISTSEVYGTAETLPMTEEHPLNPMSPYAAAKAGADRLAYSYYATYDLPIIIIRPFNNYGPNQYPEKLIPLFITNLLENKSVPVYGNGRNTRDWMHVEDHCEALDKVLHADINLLKGEVINLGTGIDTDVLTITEIILEELGKSKSLVKFIKDRAGHVKRHLSSTKKAERLLGWKAKVSLRDGLRETIKWYVDNPEWWKKIKEGSEEYRRFYERWYKEI